MDDKRMVGDYEITQSAQIGSEEIVLGYNPDDEQLPYMTGNCIQNPLFIATHRRLTLVYSLRQLFLIQSSPSAYFFDTKTKIIHDCFLPECKCQ